jgi:hypothetical protein
VLSQMIICLMQSMVREFYNYLSRERKKEKKQSDYFIHQSE